MSLSPLHPDSDSLEACIDELDALVGQLAHHPPEQLAFALRVHLATLLHVLVARGVWSVDDVQEFMAEMTQEALDVTGSV